MEKEIYLIHEVARMTGRHPNTIREYIRRGLIDEPQRGAYNRYRLFTKENIAEIKEIRRVF